MTASGWFEHDRWWLRLSGDDVDAVQFASAHESHHKQLQDSTSFGALARVLAKLASDTKSPRYSNVAADLTAASEHVHEAFASWLPAAALGWDRDRIVVAYPAYVRYYDAMDELVGMIESPYLRFHAAHSVGRACLQTTAIDVALEVGLDAFEVAHVRSRELPNARFRTLRRDPPIWSAVAQDLADAQSSDARLRALLDSRILTAELFDPAFSDLWQVVNEIMYSLVADALRNAGSPTIDHEAHLERTPRLLAAARELAPHRDLGLQPGAPRRSDRASAPVLRNIESEGFSIDGPLRARLVGTEVDPSEFIADLDDPHIFVTVRPTNRLFANYTLTEDEPPEKDAGVYARRTVLDATGSRRVELLDVSQAQPSTVASSYPIAVVTAMSVLRDPALAEWTTGEALRSTVILADVALGPHLDFWLASPAARFHYALIRSESFGRVVPFLVARVVIDGDAASALMMRPLSHAAVRIHKATFEELDPTGERIVEGLGFLHGAHELVSRCLAHVAGEEVRFSGVT